jgi:hypothetical protein
MFFQRPNIMSCTGSTVWGAVMQAAGYGSADSGVLASESKGRAPRVRLETEVARLVGLHYVVTGFDGARHGAGLGAHSHALTGLVHP